MLRVIVEALKPKRLIATVKMGIVGLFLCY